MAKELCNNLVIEGFLVLFNMVSPHGEKPYFVVAESSVRNFVKVFQKFPPQLRLEIGNYAGEHGLEVRENKYSIFL